MFMFDREANEKKFHCLNILSLTIREGDSPFFSMSHFRAKYLSSSDVFPNGKFVGLPAVGLTPSFEVFHLDLGRSC